MKEIIAMHGWGGDSHRWKDWSKMFANDGWEWQSAERGYGKTPACMPNWKGFSEESAPHKKVVICHSLGSHLIDHKVLKNATHVVLLSSFSRFIPEGTESRALKTALKGMTQAIGTSQEQSMFLNFLKKAAKPHNLESTSCSPIRSGLSKDGRKKLQDDLELLIKSEALSADFPANAQVLIVNGDHDEILHPSTKEILKKDLIEFLKTPPTEWNLIHEGHALLDVKLITKVKEWLK